MPEKARVFVAEDNPDWQKHIEEILNRAGHSVVARATTLGEGLKIIEQFGELQIQVATIDGNLGEDDTSGYDGRALVAAIDRLAPDVKTIGMSGLSVSGVTVDLGKGNIRQLGEAVTNL